MNTPLRDQRGSAWQSFVESWRFSKFDLGWAKCLWAYWVGHTIPYRPAPAHFTMAKQATVALVGDWGTGTPEAYKVMGQIAQFKPHIVIHLGDIYYSGTKREIQQRFLTPLLASLTGEEYIFSLCGNHDVYSGGAGYYWLVDKLGQSSSHFCLDNGDLRLVAVDTGHSDYNPISHEHICIHDEEAAWARAKIEGRKTIILSHHQPFSAYEPTNNGLISQLGTKMAAWFGGHEHRLAIYEPYKGVNKYRCVGAGAVPELVSEGYFKQNDAGPVAKTITYGDNGVAYKHSFAILKINGPEVWAEYYDEDGRRLFMESI